MCKWSYQRCEDCFKQQFFFFLSARSSQITYKESNSDYDFLKKSLHSSHSFKRHQPTLVSQSTTLRVCERDSRLVHIITSIWIFYRLFFFPGKLPIILTDFSLSLPIAFKFVCVWNFSGDENAFSKTNTQTKTYFLLNTRHRRHFHRPHNFWRAAALS